MDHSQNLSLLKKNRTLWAFSLVLGLGRFRYVSVNFFLRSLREAALPSAVLTASSLRSLNSKSLTTNRVGMTWFWLMCFKNVFTPDFLMNFFLLILRLTSLGLREMPATSKCGNLYFWIIWGILCCRRRRFWRRWLSCLRICRMWRWQRVRSWN